MDELIAPWLTAGIGSLLAASSIVSFPTMQGHTRVIAVTACATSLLLSLATLCEWAMAGWTTLSEPLVPALFSAGALSAIPMALFSMLALVSVLSSPKRDSDGKTLSGILTLTAGALMAYASGNLTVFLAGWMIALIPCLTRASRAGNSRSSLLEIAASTALLGTGAILATVGAQPFYAFTCLLFAAILRTGLFPFHGVAVARFEQGSLGLTGLLLNSLLGPFLVVRFAQPLFPTVAQNILPWVCALALFTAIYTAALGTVEREPRRLLALVFVSQSSAIFAGFAILRPEGFAGALVQWIVLGVTSTVMISICRAIEARISQPLSGERLFGLASQMPRLAVFFAVCAFALVGLPGTLGFPGEDLLIHGMLTAHPLIGILLPAAIAINAYLLFRLFSRLFLGGPIAAWAGAPDALPRERWAFAACLVLLVWGGLVPQQVVGLLSPAVKLQNSLIGTMTAHDDRQSAHDNRQSIGAR